MNTSNIFIDFHVHLYRSYNLCTVESKLIEVSDLFNIKNIGFLHTSRGSSFEFDFLEMNGWELVNQNTFKKNIGDKTIWGYRGSQNISTEGLEFQTFCPQESPTRIPLIEHLTSTSEVTILNYSTGKWFGKRGNIVKEILNSEKLASKVILSDTTGRFLPSTILNSKLPIIAGTDPLPFASEELLIGDYGCLVRTENPQDLQEIIEKILDKDFFITGRKMSKLRAISREIRLRM